MPRTGWSSGMVERDGRVEGPWAPLELVADWPKEPCRLRTGRRQRLGLLRLWQLKQGLVSHSTPPAPFRQFSRLHRQTARGKIASQQPISSQALRYVEALQVSQVLDRLSLSESVYYLELQRAMERVSAVLWERWGLGERSAASAARDRQTDRIETAKEGRGQPLTNLPVQLTSFVGREKE